MDLYQIFIIHNRKWSVREVVCFGILLCMVTVYCLILFERKKIILSQVISSELLFSYIVIVLESTVFARQSTGIHENELQLFWSWKEVLYGNFEMLTEIVLNILVLFPMGLLLPIVFHSKIRWWQGALIGWWLSAIIEICQLILCRGLFEWDDMIHNSMGCMFGCILMEKWLKSREV